MLITRKCGADQNRIAATVVGPAVGYAGDVIIGQDFTALQQKRLIKRYRFESTISGSGIENVGYSFRLMNFNSLVAPAFTGDDADVGFCHLEGSGNKSD